MSDLVGNPDCWFSHAMAQFYLVFYIIFTKEECSLDLGKSIVIDQTIIIISSLKPLNRQISSNLLMHWVLFTRTTGLMLVQQFFSQVGKMPMFPPHYQVPMRFNVLPKDTTRLQNRVRTEGSRLGVNLNSDALSLCHGVSSK